MPAQTVQEQPKKLSIEQAVRNSVTGAKATIKEFGKKISAKPKGARAANDQELQTLHEDLAKAFLQNFTPNFDQCL